MSSSTRRTLVTLKTIKKIRRVGLFVLPTASMLIGAGLGVKNYYDVMSVGEGCGLAGETGRGLLQKELPKEINGSIAGYPLEIDTPFDGSIADNLGNQTQSAIEKLPAGLDNVCSKLGSLLSYNEIFLVVLIGFFLTYFYYLATKRLVKWYESGQLTIFDRILERLQPISQVPQTANETTPLVAEPAAAESTTSRKSQNRKLIANLRLYPHPDGGFVGTVELSDKRDDANKGKTPSHRHTQSEI